MNNGITTPPPSCELHGDIPPRERVGVMLWFYLGGAGFCFTILGCGIVTLALALVFFGVQR